MRNVRLAVVLSIAATISLAIPTTRALAQSSRLWSERSAAAPVLAQVPDFATLAKQVVPAVVSIQVEQKAKVSSGRSPRDQGDYFRWFLPDMPREFRNRGIGTGFVIRSEGLILTNNHVVEGAENIEVTFMAADGSERTMSAKVLGTAPEYDVALVQTHEDAKAAIAYLGDSDAVSIGDWVMAVGNPFGLSHSVSVGIISAKERRDIAPSGRAGLYDFLQTDASINPGNSGGPLVNTRGEIIGMNTAINAQGSGIGFAIPINMVKNMLPDLKNKGRYARSWIGIKIQPLTSDLAQSYGLSRVSGALVSEVVPNSPAEKAGLEDGDVILTFDGKELRHSSDLPLFASMAGIGKQVPLKLWRGGRETTVQVTLSEFPDEQVKLAGGRASDSGQLGVTVNDITPALREQFNLEVNRGVVIREVEPGGVADRAGLRPGDVVLSLNNEPMKTARAFAEGTRRIKSGGVMRLQVLRQGSRLYVALKQP